MDVSQVRGPSLLLKPGITDVGCALLLAIGSAIAVRLEPAHRDFWLLVPLSLAATLLVTAVLLALNVRVATILAAAIHIVLLIFSALATAVCLLLFVTIIFFGMALVLFPPFLMLTVNSVFTLRRIAVTKPGSHHAGHGFVAGSRD